MKLAYRYMFLAAGAVLLLGALHMPYSFYSLVRTLTAVAAVFLMVYAINEKKFLWIPVALVSFALWFPLFEIQNSKSVWVTLDLIFGALYMLVGLVTFRKSTK